MKKIVNLLILIILIGIIYGFYYTYSNIGHNTVVLEKRDTVQLTDTQYVILEKNIYKPNLVKDTVFINDSDTIKQRQYIDTLCLDTDTIIAQSYISGQDAKLDSLSIQLKKTNIKEKEIITIEREIIKERRKTFKDRLYIAPSVGVGYGMINNKVDIYIGVSAGIKF